MANRKYNERAEDKLDLCVKAELVLSQLEKVVKKTADESALVHGVAAQFDRLKQTRYALQASLKRILANTQKQGLIGYFKRLAAIRDLRSQLSAINQMISSWMESVCRFMVTLKPSSVVPIMRFSPF